MELNDSQLEYFMKKGIQEQRWQRIAAAIGATFVLGLGLGYAWARAVYLVAR